MNVQKGVAATVGEEPTLGDGEGESSLHAVASPIRTNKSAISATIATGSRRKARLT
jgi:hypothetical protein